MTDTKDLIVKEKALEGEVLAKENPAEDATDSIRYMCTGQQFGKTTAFNKSHNIVDAEFTKLDKSITVHGIEIVPNETLDDDDYLLLDTKEIEFKDEA